MDVLTVNIVKNVFYVLIVNGVLIALIVLIVLKVEMSAFSNPTFLQCLTFLSTLDRKV